VELGFEIDGTLQQLPLPRGRWCRLATVIAQLIPSDSSSRWKAPG
jgi:hypothetical protein